MRVFLIVHGIVQGVGYRSYVKRTAIRNTIKGSVMNAEDGSVHVFAEGNPDDLKAFEKEINISMEHGPQVHHIERFEEPGKVPKDPGSYDGFVIEKDY